LHGDHPRRRLLGLQTDGDAAGQRPAAHGHEGVVDALQAARDLVADGAGAFDQRAALAVIDERAAVLFAEQAGAVLRFVNVPPAQMQPAAEQADHRLLHRIGAIGQENIGRRVQQPRRIGDTLAMIAGGGGHRGLDLAELAVNQQRIERTAQLEGGDRRRRLHLEPDIGIETAGQAVGAKQWRWRNMRLQPAYGREHAAGIGGSRHLSPTAFGRQFG
jgi:hypothetical protein